MRYYFTFGSGHHDKNHASLRDKYTCIDAPSEEQARIEMSAKRGDKWSSISDNGQKFEALIRKYGLTPIWFSSLTEQDGPTK